MCFTDTSETLNYGKLWLIVEHWYDLILNVECWCGVDAWYVYKYVLQISAYMPYVMPELELFDRDAM